MIHNTSTTWLLNLNININIEYSIDKKCTDLQYETAIYKLRIFILSSLKKF